MQWPAYLNAYDNGVLRRRVNRARETLRACRLCPRQCGVNRLAGDTGVCKTGESAWVSGCDAHFGEEAPLVGRHGSGTIFFTHCNLLCSFCQNFDISHQGRGREVSAAELAGMMMALQQAGCHNVNLVTPSHVVPQILAALEIAVDKGLRVPLVFNSSGYDRVRTLELLDGIVDIYMPDFKFWNPGIAALTCNAADYPRVTRWAIREMHRQVGELVIDAGGLARSGVLVRHLVLPRQLAGTREIMRFISAKISPRTYVNVMPQYRPCGRVRQGDHFDRCLEPGEYEQAQAQAREEGINRLDRRPRALRLF